MTSSLIALAHVGGSIAVVVLLVSFFNRLETRSFARNRAEIFEEASTKLGVNAEELDSEELRPDLLQFFAERFSAELRVNRVSDFLGIVRACWSLLEYLLQAVVLSGVIWYTCTISLKGAVHAWWIVAISLLFGVANSALAFGCKLLTGRYPGQASQARKGVAQLRQSLHLAARASAHQEENESRAQRTERDDPEREAALRERDPAGVRHIL